MNNNKKKLLVIGIDQTIPYLLKKYMGEGALPNISKLAENGVLAEGYSCPPCDTPTNWTTIATGATTAVHGATSFYLHIPGEPLDYGLRHRSRTQLSRFCKAEYFWSVADKNNFVPFVINYPGGWPSDFKNGVMSVLAWPIPESLPRMITPPITLTFTKDATSQNFQIAEFESFDEKFDSKSTPLQISIHITGGIVKKTYEYNINLIDSEGNGYNQILFPLGINNDWQNLKINEWSDWISVNIGTVHGILPCLFKVRALDISPIGNQIKLQQTAVFNVIGWTQPNEFGEKLIKNVMIPELPEEQEFEFEISSEIESYLSYAKTEATTLSQSIIFAKRELNWQVCFFHIHLLDSVNHKTLAYLYEKAPFYTEKRAEKEEEYARTAYRIVDDLVGKLMKSCVDDKTYVTFISDHGAIPTWKVANIPLALMEADLLKYNWVESKKRFIIDWERSQAFPYLEPPYIWVNLKGRDPQGIVNPKDYNEVCEEVIKALMKLKDPENGKKIVHKALKKQDASHLGQNGERIGDIIYFLEPPYMIFDGNLSQLDASEFSKNDMKKPAAYNAKHGFGAHAYYMPDTTFGEYSISVPIIMYGPGIKKGIELKEIVNLIDIAPTFSNLLQIPKPNQAQGKIIYEFST